MEILSSTNYNKLQTLVEYALGVMDPEEMFHIILSNNKILYSESATNFIISILKEQDFLAKVLDQISMKFLINIIQKIISDLSNSFEDNIIYFNAIPESEAFQCGVSFEKKLEIILHCIEKLSYNPLKVIIDNLTNTEVMRLLHEESINYESIDNEEILLIFIKGMRFFITPEHIEELRGFFDSYSNFSDVLTSNEENDIEIKYLINVLNGDTIPIEHLEKLSEYDSDEESFSE